jgi:hypothetical protein
LFETRDFCLVTKKYEIDHVLIFTSVGAPEAEPLIAFGLTEGSRNRHPGQDTANLRFFFDNAMLELLWVESRDEAQSEGISRIVGAGVATRRRRMPVRDLLPSGQ